MILKNELFNTDIVVKTLNNKFILHPGKTICIDVGDEMTVTPLKKSKIRASIIDIILNTLTPDDVKTFLVCTANVDLRLNGSNNEIVIKDNKIRANKGLCYYSVICTDTNNNILNTSYFLDNKKDVLFRYKFLMLGITSCFPILVAGLIAFILHMDLVLLVCLFAIFFICFIPSIKKISEMKKYCDYQMVNKYLKTPMQSRCIEDITEDIVNSILRDEQSQPSGKLLKIIKKIIK